MKTYEIYACVEIVLTENIDDFSLYRGIVYTIVCILKEKAKFYIIVMACEGLFWGIYRETLFSCLKMIRNLLRHTVSLKMFGIVHWQNIKKYITFYLFTY